MHKGLPSVAVDEEERNQDEENGTYVGRGMRGRSDELPIHLPKKEQVGTMRAFKFMLVIADCLLIGLQPILVRMSQVDGKYKYNIIGVNLMMELFKLAFAICLLMGTSTKQAKREVMFHNLGMQFRQNAFLMIPAFLYAINNYVKFSMLLYFSPTSAKMISNLKILVIAVLLKFVMQRSFSVLQYQALYLLVAGISINQLAKGCDTTAVAGSTFSPGAMLFTFLSLTVPSAASVFNEFSYKKNFQTHINLQNLFLYVYGTMFNVLGWALYTFINGLEAGRGIFSGATRLTVLLTINGALQGVLSSFFYKFADTILKKYSSAVATLFTGILSHFLLGSEVQINFLIGISVVLISMHQFFSGSVGSHKLTRGSEPEALYVSPSLNHLGRDYLQGKSG